LTTETSPASTITRGTPSPKLSAIISRLAGDTTAQKEVLRALSRDSAYSLYREDPVGFIRDILDERPWSIQETIARAVVEHPNVAVPSCFGSGKDWIAARIGAWWVSTGGILVATSNTFPQLRDIFWRELRRAHAKGQLPGSPSNGTDLRWEVTETGAWAVGRKPDDNDPEALQGVHGARVLVIADEANGISAPLWEATSGLVVNEASRRLAIGNPYEPVGPFYEACRSATWHVIHISVFDTPNFTGEPVDPKAEAELVSPFWLEQRRSEGLEGTAWWKAKVQGEFPDSASDQVIPLGLVEAARARSHDPDAREAAGLDVARFGSDDTALVEGTGNGPELLTVVHGHDTMAVAGLGARFLSGRRGTLAIDEGGVGGGVVDRLREQRLPGSILAVNAGSAPDNDPQDRLVNMRAQLWWEAREALYRGDVSLARLTEDHYTRLRSELTAPSYRFTSSGKVQIETKEELKKRGVASPDLADAFCLWLHARSRARRRVRTFGAAA
jgi:phage terminase large subunit